MKTISVGVSEADYEEFRKAASEQQRSIAQLIREAMAVYRAEHLERRSPLRELPALAGHRPTGQLPTKEEIYDEIADTRGPGDP